MKIAVAVVVASLVAGCSNLQYETAESIYVVRSGDTLYSIAWRHGVDYRDLARWNGISDANRIDVGQRLTLRPGVRAPEVAAAPAVPVRRQVQPPPGGSMRPDFSWPADGAIVARFGERGVLTTGIGIAAQLGSNVRAAAPGRVVYAGSGLADYGQLVIVQHNESWLTAYGHNRRLLVSQGQSVEAGQTIAEIGPGPGGSPRLYFEIRQNGDPLDPLDFLPTSG